MKHLIAPSLLAADKTKLQDEIDLVQNLGAEWLHWDVMDGIFVPNKSYTVDDVKKYSKTHKMFNDVHIMVADPKYWAPLFVEAGADLVTFHIEAVEYCPKCANKIIDALHEANCKAGISIKPCSSVSDIEPFLKKLDLVLVMSVEPGKGGQKFMPEALKKITQLRKIIDENNYHCLIEVDGGINAETGALCRQAGADVLVAGSYLFGHDDIERRIESLR